MFFRCSPPLPGHLGSRIGQVFTLQEGQTPAETLYVSHQPQFLVFRCTQPEKSSENATLCSLWTYGFIHRCLLGATLCHVLCCSSSVVSSSASTHHPPSLHCSTELQGSVPTHPLPPLWLCDSPRDPRHLLCHPLIELLFIPQNPGQVFFL